MRPQVVTLVGFERTGTFERHLSAMGSAVKYCTEAGMSSQLSEELISADIIGQYEVFVRSMPFNKHPATLTLKRICALLTVLFFFIVNFSLK